jgi:hypothetical protein
VNEAAVARAVEAARPVEEVMLLFPGEVLYFRSPQSFSFLVSWRLLHTISQSTACPVWSLAAWSKLRDSRRGEVIEHVHDMHQLVKRQVLIKVKLFNTLMMAFPDLIGDRRGVWPPSTSRSSIPHWFELNFRHLRCSLSRAVGSRFSL